MPKKNSTNHQRHPYLVSFNWTKPEWQFWERPIYSEKTKEYYRAKVQKMIDEDRLWHLRENINTARV